MRVRFYLDSRTGQPHIHGHNVTESEGEEVLANPGEDRPGTEGARIALGRFTIPPVRPRAPCHGVVALFRTRP
jgi:hypothetical protein